MIQEFSNWYLEVNPEPTSELLEARWAGIQSLSETITNSKLSTLVFIAFNLDLKDQEFLQEFAAHFIQHDKSFRTKKNNIEFSVLASAALALLMENTSSVKAIKAALAISCVSAMGKRNNPSAPWLIIHAEHFLHDCSAQLRADEIESETLVTFSVFSKKTLEEQIAANSWQECVSQLFDMLNRTISSVNKVSSQVSENIEFFEKQLKLLQEESDILWWLIGDHSRDLDVAFMDLDRRYLTLVAGKELADLTQDSPGPVAIESLLMKAIDKAASPVASTSELKTLINKTDIEWRKSVLVEFGDNSLPMMYPIHTAILKSVESSTWGEAFENSVQLSPKLKMPLERFGLLFYRERLLLGLGN